MIMNFKFIPSKIEDTESYLWVPSTFLETKKLYLQFLNFSLYPHYTSTFTCKYNANITKIFQKSWKFYFVAMKFRWFYDYIDICRETNSIHSYVRCLLEKKQYFLWISLNLRVDTSTCLWIYKFFWIYT